MSTVVKPIYFVQVFFPFFFAIVAIAVYIGLLFRGYRRCIRQAYQPDGECTCCCGFVMANCGGVIFRILVIVYFILVAFFSLDVFVWPAPVDAKSRLALIRTPLPFLLWRAVWYLCEAFPYLSGTVFGANVLFHMLCFVLAMPHIIQCTLLLSQSFGEYPALDVLALVSIYAAAVLCIAAHVWLVVGTFGRPVKSRYGTSKSAFSIFMIALLGNLATASLVDGYGRDLHNVGSAPMGTNPWGFGETCWVLGTFSSTLVWCCEFYYTGDVQSMPPRSRSQSQDGALPVSAVVTESDSDNGTENETNSGPDPESLSGALVVATGQQFSSSPSSTPLADREFHDIDLKAEERKTSISQPPALIPSRPQPLTPAPPPQPQPWPIPAKAPENSEPTPVPKRPAKPHRPILKKQSTAAPLPLPVPIPAPSPAAAPTEVLVPAADS